MESMPEAAALRVGSWDAHAYENGLKWVLSSTVNSIAHLYHMKGNLAEPKSKAQKDVINKSIAALQKIERSLNEALGESEGVSE